MIKKRTVTSNIIISVSVQFISLLVSFVLGFFVPKFIDGYQYAYWQTFVLYSGYVGVLHFGLLDGIVLRYSQYNYDQIDKERIRSQFIILLTSLSLMAGGIFVFATFYVAGVTKKIFLLVAISVISKNVVTYDSYTFQITNRIDKYALLTLAQRGSYGLIVILLLLFGFSKFEWFCIAELIGDAIGIIVAAFYNRGMYFGSTPSLREVFNEWKVNVSSGIMLMLANWSSTLVVGLAKMIVQWRWNDLIFGKVSFSFSLSNLFLTFITAISVVLFPQLKRTEEKKLPELYHKLRSAITPLLFGIMIFYFPGCWILEKYLPEYNDSLIYLGSLLPIIVYACTVNLLTNNYLKAYRKEKSMLKVNIISVMLAGILYVIMAYLFNSLYGVLISVLFVNIFKSIYSEIIVAKETTLHYTKDFIAETFLTFIFVSCTNLLERKNACVIYIVVFCIYLAYTLISNRHSNYINLK